MDKFGPFKPDEETIESWLDEFEARLLCHNIHACDNKRHWCQALVGEAGRSIIKKLPPRSTWNQIKQELVDVLGEANPRERAFDRLVHYKTSDKGLGEIAVDIMTKASKATDDVEMQHKLGLKAFLQGIPESISKELRRKHLVSVREALEEARFLQRVQEEENGGKDRVLVMDNEKKKSCDCEALIEECIKRLGRRSVWNDTRERPRARKGKCWGCGEEGHFIMQCPSVTKDQTGRPRAVRDNQQGNE